MFRAAGDAKPLRLFVLQASPPALRRQAGAGGLGAEDDEVLSRRRTISGPEALPGGPSDPLLQEPVQPRPEPRPRSTVVSSSSEITDGTATLRRKQRLPESESQAPKSATTTVVTMTTGSDTVRRRTRTSEQTERDVHSNNQGEAPGGGQPDGVRKHGGELQQNGGVVLRRRPVSEVADRTETNKETCEWMEARKSLKPPVSPKPVTLRKSQADPPTPTRRVPIPGPECTEPAQSPGENLENPQHLHPIHTNSSQSRILRSCLFVL